MGISARWRSSCDLTTDPHYVWRRQEGVMKTSLLYPAVLGPDQFSLLVAAAPVSADVHDDRGRHTWGQQWRTDIITSHPQTGRRQDPIRNGDGITATSTDTDSHNTRNITHHHS